MEKEVAKQKLIHILRLDYSGELGAIYAYQGHGAALKDPTEKKDVKGIEDDEHHHRNRIREMLTELGSGPSSFNEFKFGLIGKIIYFICLVGGWFIPMYGAGLLESGNVVEYEHAAAFAHYAGYPQYIEEFLVIAEVEWDHEEYFYNKSKTHFLFKIFPHWKRPGNRRDIRQNFQQAIS